MVHLLIEVSDSVAYETARPVPKCRGTRARGDSTVPSHRTAKYFIPNGVNSLAAPCSAKTDQLDAFVVYFDAEFMRVSSLMASARDLATASLRSTFSISAC